MCVRECVRSTDNDDDDDAVVMMMNRMVRSHIFTTTATQHNSTNDVHQNGVCVGDDFQE